MITLSASAGLVSGRIAGRGRACRRSTQPPPVPKVSSYGPPLWTLGNPSQPRLPAAPRLRGIFGTPPTTPYDVASMIPLASVPAEYKASGSLGEGGPTGRVGDEKGNFARFTAVAPPACRAAAGGRS